MVSLTGRAPTKSSARRNSIVVIVLLLTVEWLARHEPATAG
jgi:hypothetical protein